MQRNDSLARAAELLRRGNASGALEVCQALKRKMPHEPNLWYLMGLAKNRLGDPHEALEYLDKAVELRPHGPIIRMHRGQIRILSGKVEEGLEDLRIALGYKPDLAEAHELLTATLANLGRQQEAMDACRNALDLLPGMTGIRSRLADLLEQKGRLEEAANHAESVLQSIPDEGRAQYVLARIELRKGELVSARDRLQRLLERQLPSQQRSAIAGTLSKVLDLMGNYADAFKAAEQANHAMLDMVPSRLRNDESFLKRIERCREYFASPRFEAPGFMPDEESWSPFFLVGFPRSGTTLTEQIIVSSGHVEASDEQPIIPVMLNELYERYGEESYPAVLSDLSREEWTGLRARYRELAGQMCGPLDPDRHFLDKLPLNLIDLGFIRYLFPETKILVLIRDPRDVCLSCFMTQFVPNSAMIHLSSMESIVRLYESVMNLWLLYREALALNMHVLRYEDLVDDFEGNARAILKFFGIEWTRDVMSFHERIGERDVRTPSYAAVANPVNRNAVGRWRNYEKEIMPFMSSLEPFVREFGYHQ